MCAFGPGLMVMMAMAMAMVMAMAIAMAMEMEMVMAIIVPEAMIPPVQTIPVRGRAQSSPV